MPASRPSKSFRQFPSGPKSGRPTQPLAARHIKQLRRFGQIGWLGYLGGEPIAWCSVRPRETFRKLKDSQPDDDGPVWSVTCFFVRRDYRRRGLSAKLLAAAADFARKRGARISEAYPVDAGSPSYRFMGFLPLFKGHGFQEVGQAGSRRHVVQRIL